MSNYGFEDGHEPKRNIPKRVMHRTLPVNFPTRKAPQGFVRARQPLMADGLIHLDTNPRWVRISPYPVETKFFSHDVHGHFVVASHIPDVGVISRSGVKAFIDYIPYNLQREMHDLDRRTEELRAVYRDEHDASYCVHDERCIYLEPRFSNLKAMWKHKVDRFDQDAVMAVRKAVGRLPSPTTISAVREAAALRCPRIFWEHPDGEHYQDLEDVDRAFSAIMQLAMNGEIWIDLSRPFDGSTAIDRNRT
jgi:hypothetical protein